MYNFISGKNSQHVSEPVYAGCQISESKNVTVTPSKKKQQKTVWLILLIDLMGHLLVAETGPMTNCCKYFHLSFMDEDTKRERHREIPWITRATQQVKIEGKDIIQGSQISLQGFLHYWQC